MPGHGLIVLQINYHFLCDPIPAARHTHTRACLCAVSRKSLAEWKGWQKVKMCRRKHDEASKNMCALRRCVAHIFAAAQLYKSKSCCYWGNLILLCRLSSVKNLSHSQHRLSRLNVFGNRMAWFRNTTAPRHRHRPAQQKHRYFNMLAS